MKNQEDIKKIIKEAFPFYKVLTKDDQMYFMESLDSIRQKKGNIIQNNAKECTGIEIIKSGQVRVYINSANGGEITMFRLLAGDVCLFTAACMIRGLTLETSMEYEEDTELYVIPKVTYKYLSEKYKEVQEYSLEMVSEKFSDVMWLFGQFVFSNVATRLAQDLLEHRSLVVSDEIAITHDLLAKDLGTAREVVTRLLKQFQIDGYVELKRGKIKILDVKGLMMV